MPDHRLLPKLFWQALGAQFRTKLVMGDAELSYHPGTAHSPAAIVYAHGYFASALHEIAHWCVAGRRRRLLRDFGYWYEPDGRPFARQLEFEKVEVAPQALRLVPSGRRNGNSTQVPIILPVVRRLWNLFVPKCSCDRISTNLRACRRVRQHGAQLCSALVYRGYLQPLSSVALMQTV